MLTHLYIKNFSLVDTLDIEFDQGLTVITGETGAGKSMVLDAIAFTLGDKADGDKVRHGCKRAEIIASFDISSLPQARQWLHEHDLVDEGECILRRLLGSDGRSRSYINGNTVTLSQLRDLAAQLIDLHRQHEHQSLRKAATHRRLLDEFGGFEALSLQVVEAYRQWDKTRQQWQQCSSSHDELNARFQLLQYQVNELDALALEDNELNTLETEQKQLAHASEIQQASAYVIDICNNDEGLQSQLQHALHTLSKLPEKTKAISEAEAMLNNALIHVQEAQTELEHACLEEDDPARLHEIETRLSSIYDIARKHHVQAEELVELHRRLDTELSSMQSGDAQMAQLEQELAQQESIYRQLAGELSEKREFAAARLNKAVNEKFAALAMEHAKLDVSLQKHDDTPSPWGLEKVEFLISTNPGQHPRALAKTASGGELSRISLAIQVVTAQTSATPTLIFDEVDVGIGGKTGDAVGAMLRELGENAQVLCVTHLAQVASKAHHHMLALKLRQAQDKTMVSSLQSLDKNGKIAEIARMMGGDTESKTSLAHARQMVASQ